MIDSLIIFYWADGTWVPADEYTEAEYGWKSDDFGIITVPIDSSDEEIDMEIASRLS